MNSIKFTLFLSDVEDLETGAFGYLPGSHRRDRDDILNRVATHLLLAQNWIDERADLHSLPNELRQKATFGGDIIPGSDIETDVLAAERVIIGSSGRCVLFDTLGAHRGGMVQRGSRKALQIGLFDKAWGMHGDVGTP